VIQVQDENIEADDKFAQALPLCAAARTPLDVFFSSFLCCFFMFKKLFLNDGVEFYCGFMIND